MNQLIKKYWSEPTKNDMDEARKEYTSICKRDCAIQGKPFSESKITSRADKKGETWLVTWTYNN